MTTQINNSSRYFTSIRVGTLMLGTKPSQQFTYTSPIRIGNKAGQNLATGDGTSVVIGDNSAPLATSGSTTIVGSVCAGALTSGDATIFGYGSGTLLTTGTQNAFFGAFVTTLGDVNYSTAVGSNTYAGELSVSAGYIAMAGALTSSANVAVGYGSGTRYMGSYNTACGGLSLRTGTGAYSSCCAFGYKALGSGNKSTAVDGASAFGYEALLGNNTGPHNSAFGYQSGRALSSGGYNALFGYQAGWLLTGSYNTLVGSDAAGGAVSGAVALGYGVTAESNTFTVTVGGASPVTMKTDCVRQVFGSTMVPGATDYLIVSFNGTAKKIALYD